MPYPNWTWDDAAAAQAIGNTALASQITSYLRGEGPMPPDPNAAPAVTPPATTPTVMPKTSIPFPTSMDPAAIIKWSLDEAAARGASDENAAVLAYGLLDSIYPYVALAQQKGVQEAMAAVQLQVAGISAGATVQAAGISAAAQVETTKIDAAARLEAQRIAVAGQLEAIDRQIKADLQRLVLGETGMAQRLQSELNQRAELANQATLLQVELVRMGDTSAAQRLQAQLDLTAQQINAQIQSEQQRAMLGEQGAAQRLQASLQIQASITSATLKVDIQKTLMGEQGAAQRLQASLSFAAEQTNAQIMGNLQGILMGETGATQRLQAQLDVEAQKINMEMRWKVAEAASQTGLRDALKSRLFVHGMGEQPGVGTSALMGAFKEVQAPRIPLPQLGWAPNVQAPNVQMPDFGDFQIPDIPVPTVGTPSWQGGLTPVTSPTVGTPSYNWQPPMINPPVVPLPVTPPSTVGDTSGLSPVTTPNVTPIGQAPGSPYSITSSPIAGLNAGNPHPPVLYDAEGRPYTNPAYTNWEKSTKQGYREGVSFQEMTPSEQQLLATGQQGALANYNQKYGYQSLARGTSSAGQAYLVGDGAGIIPGVTEVLQVKPKGQVNVIPLAGTAQEGIPEGWSNVTKAGATPGTSWWTGPTGGESLWRQGSAAPWETAETAGNTSWVGYQAPTPALAPVGSSGGGGTAGASGGLPSWLNSMMPLADAANIPALVAARSGKAPPAFQQYGGPIDIGFGMGSIPEPAKVASVFSRIDPWMQEDILQAYEMAGIPREFVQWQMGQATPGFRFNPRRAFSFA